MNTITIHCRSADFGEAIARRLDAISQEPSQLRTMARAIRAGWSINVTPELFDQIFAEQVNAEKAVEFTDGPVIQYAAEILTYFCRIDAHRVKSVRFGPSNLEATIIFEDGSTQAVTGVFADNLRNLIPDPTHSRYSENQPDPSQPT